MIDWITISQKHKIEVVEGIPQLLPVLNSGYIVSITKNDKGEFVEEYNTSKRFKHEGSHDSSVQILCDGQTVTVSGNIGKLGREDNVFNLTIEETMDKLNALVASYGYPPFSFITPTYFYSTDTQKLELAEHFGAVITMLHICRNFKTGFGQANQMMDLLETKSIGHVKNGRTPDGQTVFWGRKGGRRYTKAYVKHAELLFHAKKKGKAYAEAFAKSEIYKYCEKNGLVRIEIELDRKTLIDKGLRYGGKDFNMTTLRKIYDERVNEIVQLDSVTLTEHDINHLPRNLHLIASAYFQGINLAKTLTRPTYYRHAKNLRAYGIDISIPYKGENTFNPIIKHISLINAAKPEWYELTGSIEHVPKAHLRVV